MFELVKKRIKQYEKYESPTIKMLGLVEVLLGLMLLITAVFALFAGENAVIFAAPMPFFLVLGAYQYIRFSNPKTLTSCFGILLFMEIWALTFIAAIIPFYLYGFPLADAVFEGISGFTTTGASIIADVGLVADSILLWRSMTQWAGGIIVVFMFSFLLPTVGVGGSKFTANEFTRFDSGNYSMQVTSAATNFIKIYCLLTISEIVLLLLFGVDPFESVCITLSCIPTGGMAPRADSIAGFGFPVQAITLVFMFLGATSFYLMFRTFIKRENVLFKSAEFKRVIEWFIGCALVIAFIVLLRSDSDLTLALVGNTVWESLYCVVSAGTTTGFGITDYTVWPMLAMMVLLLVEFVGGMSGSTSGGIKMYRLMAIKAYIAAGMSKILHPNEITSVDIEGNKMDSDSVIAAVSTVLLFIIAFVVGFGIILVLEEDLDMVTCLGIVMASITNAGVGIGDIGPMDSFAGLTDATKYVLSVLMFLGRTELVMVIIVFTRKFWREVRINGGFGKVTTVRTDRNGRRSSRSPSARDREKKRSSHITRRHDTRKEYGKQQDSRVPPR